MSADDEDSIVLWVGPLQGCQHIFHSHAIGNAPFIRLHHESIESHVQAPMGILGIAFEFRFNPPTCSTDAALLADGIAE